MRLLARCFLIVLIFTVYGVAQLPSSRCDSAKGSLPDCPFLPPSDSNPGATPEFSGALTAETSAGSAEPNGESSAMLRNKPGGDSDYQPSIEGSGSARPADFNRSVYYR